MLVYVVLNGVGLLSVRVCIAQWRAVRNVVWCTGGTSEVWRGNGDKKGQVRA